MRIDIGALESAGYRVNTEREDNDPYGRVLAIMIDGNDDGKAAWMMAERLREDFPRVSEEVVAEIAHATLARLQSYDVVALCHEAEREYARRRRSGAPVEPVPAEPTAGRHRKSPV